MTIYYRILFISIIFITILSPLFGQDADTSAMPPEDIDSELLLPIEGDDIDEETAEINIDGERFDADERALITFTFWDFLRMVLILGFVILCIYALFYFLKKASIQKFDENDLMNVISSKGITTGKALHIVEIGNQIIVVGTADNSVSMLTEITDKETLDKIQLYKGEKKRPIENSFFNYFTNNFLGGRKNPQTFDDSFANTLKKNRQRAEKM